MSNALLHLAVDLKTTIEQKFLVKGHTQMECDSVHGNIERKIKGKKLSYQVIMQGCVKKQG